MMIVNLILLKNRNFARTKIIVKIHQNLIKCQFVLQKINIQIIQVFQVFQNFWSSRSIRKGQITTDCSVLTYSVFFVLCAYFDGSMVFFDEFFSIEKLEYSIYNTKIKYELVLYNTYISDLLFLH